MLNASRRIHCEGLPMLIDFEELHRTYMIGRPVQGVWQYLPTNEKAPRSGFFPSSHQVFSNNALQIAVYLYNSVSDAGICTGVSHCLYLNFTHKDGSSYLLNNDKSRLAFNLDLGLAGELYSLAIGLVDEFKYRVVRSRKTPKSIHGAALAKDGRRIVCLMAEGSKDGTPIRIEVDLDKADLIALAAHCIAYGRMLYPSLSDTAVQSLLAAASSNSRACAENGQAGMASSTPSEAVQPASSPELSRHRRAIWAIGNQKWPSKNIEALQRIQAIDSAAKLQALIDEANNGDFRTWDSYLL